MRQAPESLHTLIVSGDVFIRSSRPLQPIPEADVVCYGLWVDPSLAKNHGVFFMNRHTPDQLDFVLQKPSTGRLAELSQTHLALMDIGIWLLNDHAVKLLKERSDRPYDLYSEFGTALGQHPTSTDADLNALRVAILPLEGGEFYHYGTTPEMISSTLTLQNLVLDQRMIIQKNVKKHPAVFVQNAIVETELSEQNSEIWIENAHVPASWKVSSQNVVTGIPRNDWNITLQVGQCVDVQAIGASSYVLRPYGYRDAMRGDITKAETVFLGQPVTEWFKQHNIDVTIVDKSAESTCIDLQATPLFPVCDDIKQMGRLLAWMLSPQPQEDMSGEWASLPRLSADDIAAQANLERQSRQRKDFLAKNIPGLARNYQKSVFYQIDLKDIAEKTGLDISTVSRVSNQKYAQTRWGIFPLRFFFTNGFKADNGEELVTKKLKLALKDIIDHEDKTKPFNDTELMDRMAAKGYQVARRTISKYREQMGIPVARLRK